MWRDTPGTFAEGNWEGCAGEAQVVDGEDDDGERERGISPHSLAFYRVPGVVAMLLMVDNGGEMLDSVGGYSSLSGTYSTSTVLAVRLQLQSRLQYLTTLYTRSCIRYTRHFSISRKSRNYLALRYKVELRRILELEVAQQQLQVAITSPRGHLVVTNGA